VVVMQRREHIGEVTRYLVDARALTRFHYADESEKPVHQRHSNVSVVMIYSPEFRSDVFW
jgi:hypothetical protein